MGWRDNRGEILRIDSKMLEVLESMTEDGRNSVFTFLRHRSNPEQTPEGFMQGVNFYEALTPKEDRPLVEEFFRLEDQKLRLMYPPGEE